MAGAGLLRSYGEGVFTSVFCVSAIPPGLLSVCDRRARLFGIPPSSYVSIQGNRPRPTPASHRNGTRMGDMKPPPRSCQGSQQSPQPFTHLRAGAGRSWMRSQVLLLQPSWRVLSPRYRAMQQTPSFSCGKHFLPLPLSHQTVPILVPSRRGPNCAAFPRHFANFGECSQPFPAGSL